MAPQTRFDWFVLTLRLLTGVMFLVSGGLKAFTGGGPAGFAQDIAHFHVLGDPWTLVLAYTLPWVEIVTGGCLLGGFLTRGAVMVSQAMTGMFIFALAQAWYRGLDVSCGCFGKSDVKTNYPLHLCGLGVLMGVLILIDAKEAARLRGQAAPGAATA